MAVGQYVCALRAYACGIRRAIYIIPPSTKHTTHPYPPLVYRMRTYSASFGKDYYRRLCTNRSPHSNHPVSKDWWNTLHHSSSMRCFGSHLLNRICRRYRSCLHRWPARIRSRLRYCRRNLHNQLRTAGNCKYLANNSPNRRVPAHTLCRMHRNCLWYVRQRSGLHEHWFRSRQPLIFHRSRHSVWFYLHRYNPPSRYDI